MKVAGKGKGVHEKLMFVNTLSAGAVRTSNESHGRGLQAHAIRSARSILHEEISRYKCTGRTAITLQSRALQSGQMCQDACTEISVNSTS